MKFIPNAVTRKLAESAFAVQKQSPHLLFGAGIVGVLGGTVLACRATLKLGETLDEVKANLDTVKTMKESGEEHTTKYLAYAYTDGAYKVAKLYGPAVLVGAVSIAALTGSHVTLTRRNASLTAAYAAITKAYDDYRVRVRAEVGEERELDIYRGISYEKRTGEDGKPLTVGVLDPNTMSAYARCFDESSIHWVNNPEYNRLFLQGQQNYANNLLHARGHIFLNEVYDMLGLPRSNAGQIVGWVISKEGDNFVDFGIFEAANSRFVNGIERSIWLDFNVDGVIYDKF